MYVMATDNGGVSFNSSVKKIFFIRFLDHIGFFRGFCSKALNFL